jgi:hypothetical protein
MGMSDPEIRKKLSEARFLQYQHVFDKQNWPFLETTHPSLPALPNLPAGEAETIKAGLALIEAEMGG